jgi:calcineurin-like phosphoesterase
MALFLGRGPTRIGVSKDPAVFNAVVIEVDAEGRRAMSIERVYKDVDL